MSYLHFCFCVELEKDEAYLWNPLGYVAGIYRGRLEIRIRWRASDSEYCDMYLFDHDELITNITLRAPVSNVHRDWSFEERRQAVWARAFRAVEERLI